MDADALLAATYRGDAGAFESLVRSQAGRLHRIARRVTGDGSLADDVLQETFLRILRVPEAARPARAAAAWLARVTVRVALNLIDSERSRRRREEHYAAERSRETMNAAPDPVSHTPDLDRPVAEAIAALSPETRAALWLHVVEGEGVREVAACLDSSRSAVSRRIRAGLASLRARLAKSGLAIAGAAAMRGVLRGSEAPPPESLIRRIVEAGSAALAAPAASSARPDALDLALAAPARSFPSLAGIAAAAALVIGTAAVLGGYYFQRPGNEPAAEPVRPIAAAPAPQPASPVPAPERAVEPVEPAPAAPAEKTAAVAGTIRDEAGKPIVGAAVYLAMTSPLAGDLLVQIGSVYNNEYFKRSRFYETRADGEGRFRLEGIRESGEARLGAFAENCSDPKTSGKNYLEALKIEEGAELTGVDLVLGAGRTLAGRVLAADGSPVADAVISVTTAWRPADHIFWPAALGPTDAEGRFRLGFDAKAAGCHLRVNSDGRGQRFFLEVPIAGGEVELTYKELARVEGRITWESGGPAAGLTVRITGRLTEPPIPVERMGLRSHVVHDGLVGADGSYAIEGVHPRLEYEIFIIDASLGEEAALRKPLTPPFYRSFSLEAGEVKTWDYAVSRPIIIRGHIRTELTGTPVREGQVGVYKDGKRLALNSIWADPDGYFEHRLTTGPGEYRFHAEPPVGAPPYDEAAGLFDERFGRTVVIPDSGEVVVDLLIFEPLVLPVRILDHAGEPVKHVQSRIQMTFPNGKKMGLETPTALDEAGRARFVFYHPVGEFLGEFSAPRNGPAAEIRRHLGQPGTVHPEVTIRLPRACDLMATLRDPSGKAIEERWIRLRVAYDDGSKKDLSVRTDERGALVEKGCLRAAPLLIEIFSSSFEVRWRSPRLDGGAADAIDLGEIVLEKLDE